MAASSTSLIDDFVKVSKIIALELESQDIEVLKYLIQDRIPIPRIAEAKTGIQLISLLREYRLLSENNLDYLIELLKECLRIDLANKVIEYRNNLDVVRNAPEAQIEERLPAPNMELLYLLFPGQTTTITIDKIEQIKQSICGALAFRVSEISYITASNCNQGYTRVRFQLPSRKNILQQLLFDALEKKPWLTELNVIELTVDSKALIKLAEEPTCQE